ncbi:SLC13 family permease [Arenicella sp. 4NH20-0111]|uniref:SLC13 family permease n=1 Tax=Arenicella sp. 4NH20-0111 TaxID=3127648 RepID=UPI0033417D24
MSKASSVNTHLFVGPLLAALLYWLMNASGVSTPASATAAITLLTAWYWATEALPIPATSLIPFALFPVFGVLNHKTAAAGMGSHIILLMLGGFLMAKALEKSGAHRRFAIMILRSVGQNSLKRLILAFMLAAALLSMWISNTATCLMLMPIVLACLNQIEDPKLSTPLILSVAYACSIGGIATLIGTPPNVIFAGVYEEISGGEFGFLDWMAIGGPIVIILLPVAWAWLSRNVSGSCPIALPDLPDWQQDEKRVVAVFSLVILLWVFRSQPFGGWTGVLGLSGIGDATVSMLGALMMFAVRSEKGDGLLDWPTATTIPWGILLMYGAGITIAKAFFESGLAGLIGTHFSAGIGGFHPLLIVLLVCLSITFFTELNSNLATTTLVLPILAAAATSTGLPIELLMIPATISASCAFMLPVATAPNAIAYATEKISVKQMMREGLLLNLLFAGLIAGLCYLLI